jgi:hypothetical protein
MAKSKKVAERPIVFFSYSWDSKEHQDWVSKLADDLMSEYGIEVILDQNELRAGKDLMYFMESSMERASKVLLILTPNYKLKAEGRAGGVGYEYSMISQGLFEVQARNDKFIPVLRSGSLSTSSPNYVKSKIYHDMSDDGEYAIQLYKLAQIIYDEPLRTKPKLGPIPDFKNKELDPHLKLINEISAKEKINAEINAILDSEEGIKLATAEVVNLFGLVKEKARLYSEKTDFRFQTEEEPLRTLILSCQGHSVVINWHNAYRNTSSGSELTVAEWSGKPVLNRYNSFHFPGKEPRKSREVKWTFDLNTNKDSVWARGKSETVSSTEIVDSAFSYILEKIRSEKSKNFRD